MSFLEIFRKKEKKNSFGEAKNLQIRSITKVNVNDTSFRFHFLTIQKLQEKKLKQFLRKKFLGQSYPREFMRSNKIIIEEMTKYLNLNLINGNKEVEVFKDSGVVIKKPAQNIQNDWLSILQQLKKTIKFNFSTPKQLLRLNKSSDLQWMIEFICDELVCYFCRTDEKFMQDICGLLDKFILQYLKQHKCSRKDLMYIVNHHGKLKIEEREYSKNKAKQTVCKIVATTTFKTAFTQAMNDNTFTQAMNDNNRELVITYLNAAVKCKELIGDDCIKILKYFKSKTQQNVGNEGFKDDVYRVLLNKAMKQSCTETKVQLIDAKHIAQQINIVVEDNKIEIVQNYESAFVKRKDGKSEIKSAIKGNIIVVPQYYKRDKCIKYLIVDRRRGIKQKTYKNIPITFKHESEMRKEDNSTVGQRNKKRRGTRTQKGRIEQCIIRNDVLPEAGKDDADMTNQFRLGLTQHKNLYSILRHYLLHNRHPDMIDMQKNIYRHNGPYLMTIFVYNLGVSCKVVGKTGAETERFKKTVKVQRELRKNPQAEQTVTKEEKYASEIMEICQQMHKVNLTDDNLNNKILPILYTCMPIRAHLCANGVDDWKSGCRLAIMRFGGNNLYIFDRMGGDQRIVIYPRKNFGCYTLEGKIKPIIIKNYDGCEIDNAVISKHNLAEILTYDDFKQAFCYHVNTYRQSELKDLRSIIKHGISIINLFKKPKDTTNGLLPLLKNIIKYDKKLGNVECGQIINFINQKKISAKDETQATEIIKLCRQIETNIVVASAIYNIKYQKYDKAFILMNECLKKGIITPNIVIGAEKIDAKKIVPRKLASIIQEVMSECKDDIKKHLNTELKNIVKIDKIDEVIEKFKQHGLYKLMMQYGDATVTSIWKEVRLTKIQQVMNDVLCNKIKLPDPCVFLPYILCMIENKNEEQFKCYANINEFNQIINRVALDIITYEKNPETMMKLAQYVLSTKFEVDAYPKDFKKNIKDICVKYAGMLFQQDLFDKTNYSAFKLHVVQVVYHEYPDIFNEFIKDFFAKVPKKQNSKLFELVSRIKNDKDLQKLDVNERVSQQMREMIIARVKSTIEGVNSNYVKSFKTIGETCRSLKIKTADVCAEYLKLLQGSVTPEKLNNDSGIIAKIVLNYLKVINIGSERQKTAANKVTSKLQRFYQWFTDKSCEKLNIAKNIKIIFKQLSIDISSVKLEVVVFNEDLVRFIEEFSKKFAARKQSGLALPYAWFKQMRSLFKPEDHDVGLLSRMNDALLQIARTINNENSEFVIIGENNWKNNFIKDMVADESNYKTDNEFGFLCLLHRVLYDLNCIHGSAKYDDKLDVIKREFIVALVEFKLTDKHKDELIKIYPLIEKGVCHLEELAEEFEDDVFVKGLPSYVFCNLLLAITDLARWKYGNDEKHTNGERYTSLYVNLFHRITQVVYNFTEKCSDVLDKSKATATAFYQAAMQYAKRDIRKERDSKAEFKYKKEKNDNGKAIQSWFEANQNNRNVLLIYTSNSINFLSKKERTPKKIIYRNNDGGLVELKVENTTDSGYQELYTTMQKTTWKSATFLQLCRDYIRKNGISETDDQPFPQYRSAKYGKWPAIRWQYLKLARKVEKAEAVPQQEPSNVPINGQ